MKSTLLDTRGQAEENACALACKQERKFEQGRQRIAVKLMVRTVEKPEIKRHQSGSNPPPFFIWLRHRTKYAYDATGNRTLQRTPSGITTCTWDKSNRMVAAQSPSGDRHTFAYDAAGRRVSKETATATAKYIRDFNRILLETDAGDATQVLYTASPGDFGNLISEYDQSNSSFHLYDALGSTEALTDAAQSVIDRYAYRAFGLLELHSGSSPSPFTFVGRQGYFYEPSLGLYYINARWYDPVTGRWLSEDPIGYAAGDANLYRYVGNGPVSAVDPSGLKKCWVIKESIEDSTYH